MNFSHSLNLLLMTLMVGCTDGEFSGTADRKKGESSEEKNTNEENIDDANSSSDDETNSSEDHADENDSDEDLDEDSDEASENNIIQTEDVASLRRNCNKSPEKSMDVDLDFTATEGTSCKWGTDGNLSKATNQGTPVTRAVYGQRKKITIPSNAVLCSVSFDGGSPSVRYDDFIHFTFDGYVLASAQFTEADFLAMGMEKSGDLIRYDRLKHIGKGPYAASLNDRTNSLCPKNGSCSMVKSQKTGSLSIDAPKEWFEQMPAKVLKQPEHDLTVWVTGQAHETDCQHSGLNFKLVVKYVTK